MNITVPADKKPGDTFTFGVPALAVAAVPMATPQAQPMAMAQPGQVPQQQMAPMPMVMFGRQPVNNTCQFCKKTGPTTVRYEPGMGSFCWVGKVAPSLVAVHD
eukprot:scaffold48787_cov52-Phaeocystis_antarctica.AAC.2